jgi:hypothetical protein
MYQLLIYRRISQRSRIPVEVRRSPRLDFARADINALQRSGALKDEVLDSSINVALQYANTLPTRD